MPVLWNKMLVVATSAMIILSAVLFSPTIVSAHHSFGAPNRPYPGSGHRLLNVSYDNNCSPSSFERAGDNGAWSWTGTVTPVQYNKVQSNCNPFYADVDLFTGYSTDAGTFAVTENFTKYCSASPTLGLVCWWGDITPFTTLLKSTLRMNVYVDNHNFGFATASDFTKQNTLVHEFGHTLGLEHVPCGDALSIMNNTNGCNSGIDTPQPHDVSDINTYYPGW